MGSVDIGVPKRGNTVWKLGVVVLLLVGIGKQKIRRLP